MKIVHSSTRNIDFTKFPGVESVSKCSKISTVRPLKVQTLLLLELIPIEMGGKYENSRVASPESVPTHMKFCFLFQSEITEVQS